MRIDSSGNLLVGKSVTTYTTEGAMFEKGGALELTTDSGRALRVHRTTNDGSLIEFNKDSTLVGSIGVNGDRIYLSGASEGVYIDDSLNALSPCTTTGGNFDNHMDLGGSASRFKDLYLSGIAYIENQIVAVGTYTQTTGVAANINIRSDGLMRRSTSSIRYKNTVLDATHGLTELLALRPVTYKGNDDGDTVFGGLIAEEVHDAGLTEFVQYNENDEPDALAYGNMVSLCIKAIQEQQAIIESQEAAITGLTTRLTALENN